MAGIQNLKNLGTLVKLGVIAIVQEVAKDGFQPIDILAPLKSQEFNERLKPVVQGYKEIIVEAADISFSEGVEIVQGLYAGYKDIKTELDVAAIKIKAQKAQEQLK